MRILLGQTLFFDPGLSGDGKTSCASCHRPDRAFTDGLAHASGRFGRVGVRNTPSVLDVENQRTLFWDGRREGLESQALDPIVNEVEQGLHDRAEVLATILRRGGQPVNVLIDAELSELGRFAVTLAPTDVAAFKTPGLRNVALTAPYMHDGSVGTLEEAIDREVYGRSDGAPPILTPSERADLVELLRALTSDRG